MKRRYREYLLRDALRLQQEEYREVLGIPADNDTLSFRLDGSDFPRTRRLVRTMIEPAKFIDRLAARGESTSMIRLHLLARLAAMRRTARIDQRAGTYGSWYGRLMQKVRDHLDQLPSPRRVPAARCREQIGNDLYPDCWENYVYERPLLRARDKKQKRLPPLERAAELADPGSRLKRRSHPPWREAA